MSMTLLQQNDFRSQVRNLFRLMLQDDAAAEHLFQTFLDCYGWPTEDHFDADAIRILALDHCARKIGWNQEHPAVFRGDE